MLELFTKEDPIRSNKTLTGSFNYLRMSYYRELMRIETFYQTRVYAVKNTHILVRLLNTLTVSMTYDYDKYVSLIQDKTPYLNKNFDITDHSNEGEVHKGIFYGPDTYEILIGLDNWFDVDQARINWKQLESVRVINHPRSDLGLLLPNGKKSSSDFGLAVIGIHLPMLALQWRCFTEEQNRRTDGSKLGLIHFIHMYVLPNMLRTQTSLITLNRINKLLYSAPMGFCYYKHPFAIIDYSNKIDYILKEQIEYIKNKRLDFISILRLLPSLVNNTLYDSLLMNRFPETIQGSWAYYMSRLNVYKLLVDLMGDDGIVENREQLKNFRLDTRYILSTNMLKNKLPKDLFFETMRDIDYIMSR